MLEEALLRTVVGGAGQAREVDEDGDFPGGCLEGLWGEVEVEGHFAFGGGGGVGKLEELSAERGDGCFGRDGHGWSWWRDCLGRRGRERERERVKYDDVGNEGKTGPRIAFLLWACMFVHCL